MKKILFSCIFIATALSLSAQKIFNWWDPRDENIDSLMKVLSVQKDTDRINTLNNLCYAYSGLQKDSSIQYAENAYTEALRLKYAKGIIVALFYKSQLINDLEKAKDYLKTAIALGLKNAYTRGTGLSCTQLGWLYCTSGQFDSSFAVLSVADSLAKKYKDGIIELQVYHIRGVNYFNMNHMYEALQMWTKASPIVGQYLGDEGAANNLHDIGRIYTAIGDQQKAVYYLKQSINYREQHHQTADWGNFTEIADSYLALKEPDSALYFINKGIALADSLSLDSSYREGIKTEQFVMKTKILVDMGNYDEAHTLILPYYKQFDKENNFGLLTATLPLLAEISYYKKDYQQALLYCRRYTNLMKALNWTPLLNESYRLISNVFGKLNMNDSAYYYLHAYYLYKDSTQESNVNNNTTFYKTMSENEASQSRIQLLEKDNELKRQRLNIIIGFLITLILLSAVIFYLINLKRRNERQLRELAENELQMQRLESNKTQAELERHKAELQTQAIQAQMNELLKLQQVRSQIAEDLHDDIGSTLTSISYYSELVKMQLPEESNVNTILNKIGSSARDMMTAMSDIVWVIKPANDNSSVLTDRMKNFAAETLSPRFIKYKFDVQDDIERINLNMQQRKNIYLIYKETIHNAVKYSKCSEIKISFTKNNDHICLKIEDDGVGFCREDSHRGNGLLNMEKRAKEIEALIEILSIKERGTTVSLNCKITTSGD